MLMLSAGAFARQPPPNPNTAETSADHRNMTEQLGIRALRPGPSGNESAPNHANYDERLANPYPTLPDPLTLKNGKKVTTAETWWKQRRPEIVEDFDREVLGRVPRNVPKVAWRVSRIEQFTVSERPVVGKELIGAVDNSAYPEITVEIQMTLVTPANATRPVPVMVMFGGRSGMPPAPGAPPPPARGFGPGRGGTGAGAPGDPIAPQDPPATEQLIADGWGYATINPGSIQADTGAGLTKGVIGLVNKGRWRRPDDWGALRAWAWGASRGLDYMKEKMPAVKVGLLDGQLAWRQHDGGHTDGPNWKYFIPWADRFLKHSPSLIPTSGDGPADRPAPRTDQNSMTAHAQLLEKAKQGRIDVYFAGDSIVRRWGALDYPALLANWKQNFHGWNAANFAWGGDRTQNILWRVENGELDGVNPRVIVLLAGTNNVGAQPRDEQTILEIARGVKAIIDVCQQKAPSATIILTAIFPRNDNLAVMPTIDRINEKLATFADGQRVRFLNINDRLADSHGRVVDGVLNDRDKLHPTLKGYQIWADALKPIFHQLLGPPAATDLAPAPTGDPSAAGRVIRP